MSISTSVLLLACAMAQVRDDAADVQRQDGGSPATSPAALRQAVQQLGHAKFHDRQEAMELLWRSGAAAEPILKEAAAARDAETRVRAASLLERLRLGVTPRTPPETMSLYRGLRAAQTNDERLEIWLQLKDLAPVRMLIQLADDPAVGNLTSRLRRDLLDRLEAEQQFEQALALASRWRGDATQIDYGAAPLAEWIDAFLEKHLQRLLLEGQADRVEQILEQGADHDEGLIALAAYHALAGTLPRRIEQARRDCQAADDAAANRPAAPGDPGQTLAAPAGQRRLLFVLLRAAGESSEARRVAEELLGRSTADDRAEQLLLRVLWDQRDWSALARLADDKLRGGEDVEQLGFAAAFHRLAGHEVEFRDRLARLQQMGRNTDLRTLEQVSEALMINGLGEEGAVLLKLGKRVEYFRMLVRQDRYREAFELLAFEDAALLAKPAAELRAVALREAAASAGTRSVLSSVRFDLCLETAAALVRVGEQNEAEAIFSQLAAVAETHHDAPLQLRKVARAALQAGLVDDAFLQASRSIELDALAAEAIKVLFPRSAAHAHVLWTHLSREAPDQTPLEKLDHLRGLFYRRPATNSGQAQPADRDSSLVRADLQQLFSEIMAAKEDDQAEALEALGQVCLLNGVADLAERCFTVTASTNSAAAVALGDLQRGREDWTGAAESYRLAWEQDRSKAFALYLHGEMLARLGQADTAERMRRVAILSPPNNSARHQQLAMPLYARDVKDVALAQWELILRTADWSDEPIFLAAAAIADVVRSEQPDRATDLTELRLLNCLRSKWLFPETFNYLRVGYLVQQARTNQHFRAGQVEAAAGGVERCRKLWRTNLETAEQFVPLLQQAGRADQAAELFTESYGALETICTDFPRSAMHHNNLAWLSARCQRRLDDALMHAQRALELAPDTAMYLDTLGEVQFRRGDTAAAIESARRCIALEPTNAFYREQLARFQGSSPTAAP